MVCDDCAELVLYPHGEPEACLSRKEGTTMHLRTIAHLNWRHLPAADREILALRPERVRDWLDITPVSDGVIVYCPDEEIATDLATLGLTPAVWAVLSAARSHGASHVWLSTEGSQTNWLPLFA